MEKKIKYLDINIEDGVLFDKKTKQEIGAHLELYYKISDNNSYYFEKPEFESFDNYEIVSKINGQRISLRKYLTKKDYINGTKYLLISTHSKILDIYDFPVHINNNYFSIPINVEISTFMEEEGFENFYILPKLYNLSALNLSIYEFLSGWEILFFLSSTKLSIRKVLNDLRYQRLKINIAKISERRISSGFSINFSNRVRMVKLDLLNKERLNRWEDNPTQSINLRQFIVNGVDTIKNCVENYKDLVNEVSSYEQEYLLRIRDIFKYDFYEKVVTSCECNILNYGSKFTLDSLSYSINSEKKIEEKQLNYYGRNPYIVTAPFGVEGFYLLPKKKVQIDDDLTVLIRYGQYSGMFFIGEKVISWDYPSIKGILSSVSTSRVLIIDGNDSILLKDLDTEFIKKAEDIKDDADILVAGSVISLSDEIPFKIGTEGWSNHPNYSLMYGEPSKILEIYSEFLDNASEEVSVDINFSQAFKNKKIKYVIDSDNKLFITLVNHVHSFYEMDETIYCKEDESFVNKNSLIMG